jgi:hypothetical protein
LRRRAPTRASQPLSEMRTAHRSTPRSYAQACSVAEVAMQMRVSLWGACWTLPGRSEVLVASQPEETRAKDWAVRACRWLMDEMDRLRRIGAGQVTHPRRKVALRRGYL